MPQSPTEFRQAVQEGGFGTRFEARDIARPFPQVFDDLSRQAEQCLNKTVTSSTPGKYGPETASVDYHATVKRLGDGSAEVVVQQNAANIVGDVPSGGPYIQVVDVAAQGETTRVTVYGSSFRDELFDVFFGWAAGKNADCPDF
jgi:hypothetical protein